MLNQNNMNVSNPFFPTEEHCFQYKPITDLLVSTSEPNAQILVVFSGRLNLQELHCELKYLGKNDAALE